MARKKEVSKEAPQQGSGRVIGIDLGTTTILVAEFGADGTPKVLVNAEGHNLTPSVVNMKDESKIVVGRTAVNQAGFEPGYIVANSKRSMGKTDAQGNPVPVFVHPDSGNAYGAPVIAGYMLRSVVDGVESGTGRKVDGVVITVPAYFKNPARLDTKKAAELAGLNVLRIINEPTAAAIAYGLDKGIEGSFVICDLGGGTFDVTVLKVMEGRIDVLTTDGDTDLGGADIDEALLSMVLQHFKEQTGVEITPESDLVTWYDAREKCQRVKEDLSQSTQATFMISANGKRLVIEVSRETLNDLIKGILDKAMAIVERTMAAAKLTWQQITGVVLVGGSTRIPAFRERIKALSGKEPLVDINPDEAVALGAAIVAARTAADQGKEIVDVHGLRVLPPPITVTDVNSHPLGCLCVDRATGREKNSVIIPANTPLPAQKEDTFGMLSENQTAVNVVVLQGPENAEPADCVRIGEVVLRDLPPGLPVVPRIKITYGYNVDGIIQVTATDSISGRSTHGKIEHRSGVSQVGQS